MSVYCVVQLIVADRI